MSPSDIRITHISILQQSQCCPCDSGTLASAAIGTAHVPRRSPRPPAVGRPCGYFERQSGAMMRVRPWPPPPVLRETRSETRTRTRSRTRSDACYTFITFRAACRPVHRAAVAGHAIEGQRNPSSCRLATLLKRCYRCWVHVGNGKHARMGDCGTGRGLVALHFSTNPACIRSHARLTFPTLTDHQNRH